MDGTVSCAVEKHQNFPISNRFLVNSNAKSIQIQNISQRSLKRHNDNGYWTISSGVRFRDWGLLALVVMVATLPRAETMPFILLVKIERN